MDREAPLAGALDQAKVEAFGGRMRELYNQAGLSILVGVGLNSALGSALGWPLVDEHRRGAVPLALGENRYPDGRNASSLNLDLAPPAATPLADGREVVAAGELSRAAGAGRSFPERALSRVKRNPSPTEPPDGWHGAGPPVRGVLPPSALCLAGTPVTGGRQLTST
jgi:hypothetical protein